MSSGSNARELPLDAAAAALALPISALGALIAAGYLRALPNADGSRTIELTELKAFIARNIDDGRDVIDLRVDEQGTVAVFDEDDLLRALAERSEDMAARAFDVFAAAFPEVDAWPIERKRRFIENSRARFEAILAVTEKTAMLDDDLVTDFAEVGASAARSNTPLPDVLLTLRLSRDLVVQTALEVAQGRGSGWTMPLAMALMRILPALDKLSDAITRGYWDTIVAGRQPGTASS